MARLLYVLPDVDPGADVRLDTAEETDTPADIANSLGGVIPGALLTADDTGTLPRVYGPAAGTATLWLKVLDGDGEVDGDPVEVTGIDSSEAPDALAPATIGALAAAEPVTTEVRGGYTVNVAASTVVAFGEPDQDFAHFVVDSGGIYLSRGDIDPLADGPGFYATVDAAMGLNARLAATDDIEAVTIGKGPVLKSPDGTRYRIKVADGGVLSTEVVL